VSVGPLVGNVIHDQWLLRHSWTEKEIDWMVLAAAFLLVVLDIFVVRGEKKSNSRHSRPMNGEDCLFSYREILAMICRSIDGLGQPGEFPEGQRVLRSAHLGSQVVPRKSPDLRCYLI